MTVVDTRILYPPFRKPPHDGVPLLGGQASVQQADLVFREHRAPKVFGHGRGRRPQVETFGLLDERVDNIGLRLSNFAAHHVVGLFAAFFAEQDGFHRQRPGGSSSRVDRSRSPYSVMARVRGIGVAVITSTSGRRPFCRQAGSLHDAEAVLLVDNDHAEAVELYVLVQQGVGADQYGYVAVSDALQELLGGCGF